MTILLFFPKGSFFTKSSLPGRLPKNYFCTVAKCCKYSYRLCRSAKIKGLHSKAYIVTEAALKLMIFFRGAKGHKIPLKRLISKPWMDPFGPKHLEKCRSDAWWVFNPHSRLRWKLATWLAKSQMSVLRELQNGKPMKKIGGNLVERKKILGFMHHCATIMGMKEAPPPKPSQNFPPDWCRQGEHSMCSSVSSLTSNQLLCRKVPRWLDFCLSVFYARFGALHRKRAKETPKCQKQTAHSGCPLTYSKKSKHSNWETETYLPNKFWRTQQWTRVTAVYASGVLPVSPWRQATWLVATMTMCGDRRGDQNTSRSHPLKKISETVILVCQVVHYQDD